MKIRFLCLTTIAVCLSPVVAAAQIDLYDDGPTNGTTDAWTFNFGFVPSNSFTLTHFGEATGLEFAAWLFPGDVLESVRISITSQEFGGIAYFDQIVNTTQSGCVTNQLGFNVCTETATFASTFLNAGMYWLNLQDGVVSTGDPVYWDENSGPSDASEGSLGTLPAESFTILGSSEGTTITSTTPEPASLMLFASGVVGLAGLLRGNLHR